MWDNENISDELLAAFLDGNTTREETEMVLGVMSEDSDLMEVMNISTDLYNNQEMYSIETEYHIEGVNIF